MSHELDVSSDKFSYCESDNMLEKDSIDQGSSNFGPLSGVRILDLSSVIMGPWATQTMADLGAEVICVEAAGGDAVRFIGRGHHPMLSGISLNVLRNKRNVALNLKNPKGREAFLKIASTCDVVVTNLRPGPRARLGLMYEDIRLVREDIIYCHAQGWPTASDRGDDAAYDDVIQAASGMAALFEMQVGKPLNAPLAVADQIGSLTIVYAILAALYHRLRTGEGQCVEVPMVDAMSAFVLAMHGKDAIPEPPLGPPGYERMANAIRAPLPTKDGYLQIVLYTKGNWTDFFTSAGVIDAGHDPRLATMSIRNENYEELYTEMAVILQTKTNLEWMDWCKAHGVGYSPVVSLRELVDDLPIVTHSAAGAYRQMPIPVRFSATPGTFRREAPLPGEHNQEILREAGYRDDEITELELGGAVFDGKALNPW
jgi:crotonobetainyl-CoA:carnitine CoA-transferase CaiB-like acyl-CoA transferase